MAADFRPLAGGVLFRRGDCNGDGSLNISDAVASLLSLFGGGAPPNCQDACDANDDGTLDVSDPVTLLGMLFSGFGDLPAPGPQNCGADPTSDALDCSTFSGCP